MDSIRGYYLSWPRAAQCRPGESPPPATNKFFIQNIRKADIPELRGRGDWPRAQSARGKELKG